MAQQKLDCRGLACPGPVLKTKEIVDCGDLSQVTVLVDNLAAKENVSRFLSRCGYRVNVTEQDGTFAVTGHQSDSMSCEIMVEKEAPASQKHKIMVLLGTDRMGTGDDDLGRKLMANFIGTLKEMGQELWRLVLVNAGVKLAIEGSEVLPTLKDLENDGIHLLVCGTCLNHFGLVEQKRVGETTNMLDIVTAMQLVDKVISLT